MQVFLRLWLPEEVSEDDPVDAVRHCCCGHVCSQSGGCWVNQMYDQSFKDLQHLFAVFSIFLFESFQVPYSYIEYDSHARLWPGVREAYSLVDRYQLVNSYGLFRRMTGVGGRPEVVIEGSMDGNTWTVR